MARPCNRLPKERRLHHRRLIKPLFNRDDPSVQTQARGCVRAVYRLVAGQGEHEFPVKVAFSAGRIKGAVNRNRIKRQLREVYRLHQHRLVEILTPAGRTLTMMLLFRGTVQDARTCVRRDLPLVLDRVARSLELHTG